MLFSIQSPLTILSGNWTLAIVESSVHLSFACCLCVLTSHKCAMIFTVLASLHLAPKGHGDFWIILISFSLGLQVRVRIPCCHCWKALPTFFRPNTGANPDPSNLIYLLSLNYSLVKRKIFPVLVKFLWESFSDEWQDSLLPRLNQQMEANG